MRKFILAATVAAVPMFVGVAYANTAHDNPTGNPGSAVLEMGNRAQPLGDASLAAGAPMTQEQRNFQAQPDALGTETGAAPQQ